MAATDDQPAITCVTHPLPALVSFSPARDFQPRQAQRAIARRRYAQCATTFRVIDRQPQLTRVCLGGNTVRDRPESTINEPDDMLTAAEVALIVRAPGLHGAPKAIPRHRADVLPDRTRVVYCARTSTPGLPNVRRTAVAEPRADVTDSRRGRLRARNLEAGRTAPVTTEASGLSTGCCRRQ